MDIGSLDFLKYYDNIKDITTYYHVPCSKTEKELRKITDKKIVVQNFWINDKIYFHIENKDELRIKYNIPNNKIIIGSFQKDTEGKNKCMKPKLSKGVDILVNILNDFNNYKDIFVVLTGRRRNYIINKLNENEIPYCYFEMISYKELNELYNCLDLYIVSSRIEGGPRSIMESALCKVPIISTNVGVSELILSNESIYDTEQYLTYKNSKPNVKYAYQKVLKYTISNDYINEFTNKVFM